MFRGNPFDRLLEKATSNVLMEPDYASILQICDLIRQNDVQPKTVINALKKKMQNQNPHTVSYALQVLESVVKNCGSIIIEELITKANLEFLRDTVRTTPHENVRNKLLELIQAWHIGFRKNPKHGALKELMNMLMLEGYNFPSLQVSEAMFTASTAPEWSEGDCCHRCRVTFTVIQRKHHCRACGQVFCKDCSSKSCTLPKFGIEKEVRVCNSCYEEATNPSSTKNEKDLPIEYVNSSLAQQNQEPPKKSEAELTEEEELQLALALSQSEAEAKEKNKLKFTSSLQNFKPVEVKERSPSPPEEETNPELARYLNRSYWENFQSNGRTENRAASPSAPATAPTPSGEVKCKAENGVADLDLEEFIKTLQSQVDIFINRMKSNSSRGRSITNDTSVQTLFLNITAMHSQLLKYIQQHDDSRLHFERLQDKLAQVKDARAALDALRDEHRDKLRREAEEAERVRQMQMAQKLEIMRKKKQEYLQYQRHLTLQKIQEQEREMHMRKEQKNQQYLMGPQYGYTGSPVHSQPFIPNMSQQALPNYQMYGYQSLPGQNHLTQNPSMAPQQIMPSGYPGPIPPQGHFQQFPPHQGMPQSQPIPRPDQVMMNPGNMGQMGQGPMQNIPPPGMPNTLQGMPMQQGMPGPQGLPMQQGMGGPQGIPPQQGMGTPQGMPQQGMGVPQGIPGTPGVHGSHPGQIMGNYHQQQPGAPPVSPQVKQNGEAQTAELISFD